MAPKKPVKPTTYPNPMHKPAVDEFGPEDPADSTPTKDMAAPVFTPPERRKAFVDVPPDVPREAIALGGGSACVVCGTIGSGICEVDGHARGGA